MYRVFTMSLISMMLLACGPALALNVDVSDLATDGEHFSGSEVTVIGELVGDYGERSDGSTWAQLNGDTYATSPVPEGGSLSGQNIAVGVRIPTGLTAGLDAPGRYRTVGPIVEVVGVWKYHDSKRGGESYLDVSSLAVLEQGHAVHEDPDPYSYLIGVVLTLISGVVWRYHKERSNPAY